MSIVYDPITDGISYRPYDNLELTMGMYLFGGKSGNLFGDLKDQDQFYFELMHSFWFRIVHINLSNVDLTTQLREIA